MRTPDSRGPSRSIAGLPLSLVVSLAVLGLLLTIAVIPAPFTVDDNNYLVNVLALRQGRVTVANTEGLTPSPELLFFDPGPWTREVTATPVASTAPSLYAPLALPFSLFRWRGLVALNTLAYLLTTASVFVCARRYSTAPTTPWLAAIAFALGGFAIEYAVGVWPHALSVALVSGAVFLGGRAVETGRVSGAAAAGFLLALAAGVRYQNAAVLAATGAGIFLLASRRWRLSIAFALCAALPLAASAAINHARLGSWNPISKGQDYLHVPAVQGTGASPTDPLLLLWAQVVDYSVRPPLADPWTRAWLSYEPFTGAHLMLGLVQKKSLLQSAPWTIVAFLMLAAAWWPRRSAAAAQVQLRLMSIVVAAMLAVFSLAGLSRHDGLAFNQRYLLEVLPFAAVAFAWAIDASPMSTKRLLLGSAVGAALVLAVLLGTPVEDTAASRLWIARHAAIAWIPLLLAGSVALVWLFRGSTSPQRLMLVAGACFGWALTLHLADDVVAANLLRRHNHGRSQVFARVLPDRSALVVFWANKDAAVPLLFDRDIVILDAAPDAGADAPVLIRELLSRGRRVFFVPNGFTPEVAERIRAGLHAQRVPGESLDIYELRAGPL